MHDVHPGSGPKGNRRSWSESCYVSTIMKGAVPVSKKKEKDCLINRHRQSKDASISRRKEKGGEGLFREVSKG